MTIEEIKNIKLQAADDCILWLWVIDLHLKDALEIIEYWGFERKSTLVWVKDKMGLGSWLRNQHEICFLAIKGKPLFFGESVSSVLNAERNKHSEKPEEFYKLVEETCRYPMKLDYFSRHKRDGWVCYGDEI
jgi:N6-adenosine-specific RNA methylase IME4